MKRSEAAKYARWSAALALCLAGLTAAVYLGRGWQRIRDRRAAPPAAPASVDRQLSGLSFSKVEGNKTIYTVEASHSTDFKGDAATLLEDVKITVFGKEQNRNDVLHTRTCRYMKSPENIDCSGLVQMDLMSAEDAKLVKERPDLEVARVVHVETKGLLFNRNTGIAKTIEPITLRLPNGTGEAKGLEYRSNEGILQLEHDVRFELRAGPSKSGKNSKSAPVEIRGSKLAFDRESRAMSLAGPAEAMTVGNELKAGNVTIELDENFRAKKVVASAGAIGLRPELRSSDPKGSRVMKAETMSAALTTDGKIAGIEAKGNVTGAADSADEKEDLASNEAFSEFWPATGRVKDLNLRGAAKVYTTNKKTGEARELQSDAVHVRFVGRTTHEKARVEMAETLAPGTLQWTSGTAKVGSAEEQTKLQADRFLLDFAATGKAKLLQAKGNVRVDRTAQGKTTQTATGNSGSAQLDASGGWSLMELHGDVRLKDGEKSGQADNAVFVRAAQSVVLSGHAQARDAATETHATKIAFEQETGEILAEGGVRSTDYPSKAGAVQVGSAPANITADTLQANSKTGRAVYKGHARLWQRESTLEAESIELLRDVRTLNAIGNVRAVFVQAPANSAGAQPLRKAPQLWYIAAMSLTYWDKENRAHLDKEVTVQSAGQKIRSAAMDLYFTRGSGGNAGSPGAQQISRAVGTGGVTVEQDKRRATADRGEYSAADGKFVMTGGTPTIFDASEGTTTGRQLTFFLADATIIVDSENGSRTLTKHRVEK